MNRPLHDALYTFTRASAIGVPCRVIWHALRIVSRDYSDGDKNRLVIRWKLIALRRKWGPPGLFNESATLFAEARHALLVVWRIARITVVFVGETLRERHPVGLAH